MPADTPERAWLPEPAPEDIRLERVLHALADPARLSIVTELARGHTDMACIAFDLSVAKSTATHHFRVLRQSGVIRQYRQGTSRNSRLRTEDLDVLFPGLLPSVLNAAALTRV